MAEIDKVKMHNPMTGMESDYDLTPVRNPKRVMVAGGGVAGCEAAIIAAKKGHKVTLIEQSDRLGGQWIPASIPIGKEEFTTFLYWQSRQLIKYHVQVLLNTTADEELMKQYAPDALIIATGSRPFIPHVKGCERECVVSAHDLLLGKAKAGKNVVVIGENSVILEGKDKTERTILDVDTVVIAAGVKTEHSFMDSMERISCKVILAGDANGVKNGYLGIREGFEAGLNV